MALRKFGVSLQHTSPKVHFSTISNGIFCVVLTFIYRDKAVSSLRDRCYCSTVYFGEYKGELTASFMPEISYTMPKYDEIRGKVNSSNHTSTPDSTKALSKKIKDLKEQVKVECDAKNIAYDFILATGNYALFVAFHKARMRGDVDFDRLKFIISTLKKKEEL